MTRFALATTILLIALAANAKTPGEIYEQAAKSTVVIRNFDGTGKPQSMGSGVVLPDGDVVTNCHVIKAANQIKVRVGSKEYQATLRYSDWDRDVCSLKVDDISAPAVVIGSTKTLKVGARVYAIGAPKGLELTLSDGIVSSLREVVGGQYIQTTAAISPGSSGGGLFDENGALVGLTTFYLAEGQNLNFAVPVEWVKELPKRNVKIAAEAQTVTQWLNKSIELEKLKDWPGKLEHTRRWTKAQPTSSDAWFSLGYTYYFLGQPDKAIEAYQQALRIEPERDSAWGNLAVAYLDSRQLSKAIDAAQQALNINPKHVGAWISLCSAYDDAGQPAKAVEACKQALRIEPEQAVAWNNLAVAYLNSHQPSKAIEAAQQSLRINPEDEWAWLNLGNAHNDTGQSAKAIDAYQQALRINPEDAKTWYNLGVTYAQAGQRTKVADIYKRLKTLDPARAERFFNKFVAP